MSMRKKQKSSRVKTALTGAAIMVALSAHPHNDAHAVTDALDVEAVIIPTGQAILATQNLNFGDISESGGGTVTVNTAGAITDSPGAVSVGGTIEQGVIQTYGNPGDQVDFTIPATAVLNNGGNTMVVDQFNLRTLGGGLTENITMTGTNTAIPVGGRLNVGAGQATGTYTGAVTVTATFH